MDVSGVFMYRGWSLPNLTTLLKGDLWIGVKLQKVRVMTVRNGTFPYWYILIRPVQARPAAVDAFYLFQPWSARLPHSVQSVGVARLGWCLGLRPKRILPQTTAGSTPALGSMTCMVRVYALLPRTYCWQHSYCSTAGSTPGPPEEDT
jgi:hypothetical protein